MNIPSVLRSHNLAPIKRIYLGDLVILLITVLPAAPVTLATLSATADGWHRYPLTSDRIYTSEYFPTLPGMPILARMVGLGGQPFLAWSIVSFLNVILISYATLLLLKQRRFLARLVGSSTAVACFLLLNIESPRGWNHTSLALFWLGTALAIAAMEKRRDSQMVQSAVRSRPSQEVLGLAGLCLASSVLVKHSQAIPTVLILASITMSQASHMPWRTFSRYIVRPLALGAAAPVLAAATWAASHGILLDAAKTIFSVAGKEQGSATWLKVFVDELFVTPSQVGLVPTLFLGITVTASLIFIRRPYALKELRICFAAALAFSIFFFLTAEVMWPSIILGVSALTASGFILLESRCRHEAILRLIGIFFAITLPIALGFPSTAASLITTIARTTGMAAAFGSLISVSALFVRRLTGKALPVSALLLTAATFAQVFTISRSGTMHGALFAPVIGFVVGSLAAPYRGMFLPLVAATSLGVTSSARYSEPMLWWGFQEPPITADLQFVDFEYGGKVLLTGKSASYWTVADRTLANLPRSASDRIFSYPVNPIFVTLSGIPPVDVPCPVVWFDLCPEKLKRDTLDVLKKHPPKYLVWSPAGSDAFNVHEYNFNGGRQSTLRDFESWFEDELQVGRYKYVAILPSVTEGSYTWKIYSRVGG